MNTTQTPTAIARFLSLHRPQHQEGAMVYEVWQDGEITLTKGGDLWRKRSLHMLVAGVNPAYALPADQMPIKIGVNGSIIVESYDKALEAHRIVVSEARERHGKMAGPLL